MHRRQGPFAVLTASLALLVSAAATAHEKSQPSDGRPVQSHTAAVGCGLHGMRGEPQLAIEDCDEAIREAPRNPKHYSNRGSAYLMMNDLERAIADFGEGLRIAPADAGLYYNRGLAHAQKGDRKKAVADYTRAIELRPGLAAAYNSRGLEFELLGERENAIADYRRALELAPSTDTLRRNLRRFGAE